jgi:hypothetical protein
MYGKSHVHLELLHLLPIPGTDIILIMCHLIRIGVIQRDSLYFVTTYSCSQYKAVYCIVTCSITNRPLPPCSTADNEGQSLLRHCSLGLFANITSSMYRKKEMHICFTGIGQVMLHKQNR